VIGLRSPITTRATGCSLRAYTSGAPYATRGLRWLPLRARGRRRIVRARSSCAGDQMRTSTAFLCAWLASFSMPASAERGTYQPPRHDDGHPNFEGMWVNMSATPLVRPPGYTQLLISESEARTIDSQRIARAEDRTTPTEPTEWTNDRQIERVSGTLRSSVIIEPSDGQIPGNEAFRKRVATVPAAILHAMDGPEDRPSSERCLGSQGVQPPILSMAMGNLYLIVQTADTVVFFSEWLHDARVIRMSAKHAHPAITSWLGDAIGWWEGDTLVVQTRYFTPSDRARTSPTGIFLVSPTTTVTERFTRVSHEEMNYRFTIEDPNWYERPWTGETHFTRSDERLLEAACHEGNYNMRFNLEAARTLEAER
jgi:hypothetical protein